jgi:hypothetical protein
VVDAVGEGVDVEFRHGLTTVDEDEVVLLPMQVVLTHVLEVRQGLVQHTGDYPHL